MRQSFRIFQDSQFASILHCLLMRMCSSCSFHTGGLRDTGLGSYIYKKIPGYSEEFKGVSSSNNCFRIFVTFPTCKSVWLLVFQRLKGGQAAVGSDLKRI